MVKRRQPHRHDKSFTMGGVATAGNAGCLPAIIAAAGAVAMVIALGLELGVLYDYRVRDFKAVTDGSAFLNNGSQCLRYATEGDLVAYYGDNGAGAWKSSPFTCKDDRKDLGMLLASSVHQLYHVKAAHPEAYYAARAGAGVYADTETATATCDNALGALHAIADEKSNNPDTCSEIYSPVPTQAACVTLAESQAATAADPADDGNADNGAEADLVTPERQAGINAAKLEAGVAAAQAVVDAPGVAAAQAVVDAAGVAAANAAVAASAGGSVGDGDLGDARVTSLNTAITDLASAQAADTQFTLTTVAAAYSAAAPTITDLASAQAADTARGDGATTVADAFSAAAPTITDQVSAQAAGTNALNAYNSAADLINTPTEAAAHNGGTAYTTALNAAIADSKATASANKCPDSGEGLRGITPTDYKTLIVLDGDAAGATAPTVTADSAITAYNLYLQCVLTAGLGNVPPVATADNLVQVPTASRGGTLDIPLYQRKSTSETDCFGYLQPAYTPPPMLYGDFNCSVPRQARAKVMYGARLGWSLFATVPCVILIVYLGADAALAALCFFFRASAERATAQKTGVNAITELPKGVVTQLATISEMRYIRLGLSLVGFLLVVILKAVYDWAPWVTGTVLPQATTCGENGWQTEQDATVTQFIVIILILATIVILPVSQFRAFSSLLGTERKARSAERQWQVFAGTGRIFLWIVLVVLAGIVLVAFEAADGVAWGISWAGRQLEVYAADMNALDVDQAATLVEKAATSAVLAGVSMGALIALVYARWLFTSKTTQGFLCSFIWLGCVVAGLIPIVINFGFKVALNPDEQEVLSDCDYHSPDSFEHFLCKNRAIVFTISLLVLVVVFGIMWCCWLRTVVPSLFKVGQSKEGHTSGGVTPATAGAETAANAPFQTEKIPLLSLRVRQ